MSAPILTNPMSDDPLNHCHELFKCLISLRHVARRAAWHHVSRYITTRVIDSVDPVVDVLTSPPIVKRESTWRTLAVHTWLFREHVEFFFRNLP
jgi:hypothetical protein